MDQRTIVAIAISFLIFLGWDKFYLQPQRQKAQPAKTVLTTQPAPNAAEAQTRVTEQKVKTALGEISSQTKELKKITSDQQEITLSNHGRSIESWTFQNYPQQSLGEVTHSTSGNLDLSFDNPELGYLSKVSGQWKTISDLEHAWKYRDGKIDLEKIYLYDPLSGVLNLKVKVNLLNKYAEPASMPKYFFLFLEHQGFEKDNEQVDRQILVREASSLERIQIDKVDAVQDFPGPIHWIGAQTRYFLFTLQGVESAPRAVAQKLGSNHSRVSLQFPVESSTFEKNFKVFFGPKQKQVLEKANPEYGETIELGFFAVVAKPILWFMIWLYKFLHNWGLAIIVLTIFIKVLTFPLTVKSMSSMKKMSKLQPQIEALRKKHANDKEAMNRELMGFMKENGYNPASGCLPILIQMPIFFALYKVLYSSIELYRAPFFGWIMDLSVKDPYYVTPVLLTIVMFFQQKLTPSTVTDPVQKKVFQWMPLFFGLLMLNLPSGLTLYMLVNAATGIIQQLLLNKMNAKNA